MANTQKIFPAQDAGIIGAIQSYQVDAIIHCLWLTAPPISLRDDATGGRGNERHILWHEIGLQKEETQ